MNKKFVLGFSFLATVALAASPVLSKSAAAGYKPSVYTIDNHYNYRATLHFEETVDSIEAWVNVPINSLGGVIMGTYTGYDSIFNGFNLEVDALGRIKLVYDDGRFNYTFINSNIMDGKRHHVALVRDDNLCTLTLYVDGKNNETYNVKLNSVVPKKHLYIGTNPCFWNRSVKKPLEGKISQVTLYHGAISQSRVVEDMNNKEVKTDDNNADLLANWYFGENWTERNIYDTSDKENHCVLETYEKYVGVADNRDYDYSFIVLPDVQCMNRYKHSRFSDMIKWIVDNKEELKLKFLFEVGDLSDVGTEEKFYRTCAEAMNQLNGEVPWSFVPGNHDYDDNCKAARTTNYFNTYFPYSVHSKLPGFGGAYEEGKMENTYYLHEFDGYKYCIINLEFGPRLEVLRWANRICEKFPEHRVIVQTHAYINPSRTFLYDTGAGEYAWRNTVEYTEPYQFYDLLVRKNKNIFMAVGGHYCSDDIMYVPSIGDNGNKIHSFLIDNQGTVYGNEGIGQDVMAIFKVNEKRKSMSVCYYSPYYDAAFNIQNQFEFYFGDAVNPTIGL